MRCCLVYVTTRNEDEALRIGRTLVEEKLCACVNITGPIRSLYLWEGQTCDEPEVALIAKTTEAVLPHLIERTRTLHSYDNPCIVALPVNEGSAPFLDWIRANTAAPSAVPAASSTADGA